MGLESKYSNPLKYNNLLVKQIIIHHLIKMNILINNNIEFPSCRAEVEKMICNNSFPRKQWENYQNNQLFVLSTFFYYLIELMPTSFFNELDLPIIDEIIQLFKV